MPVLANIGQWMSRVLLGTFSETLLQLLLLVGPLALVALWLHLLERIVQPRLARAFGWSSVLWTGWLGTPLHELSHAAFCVLFRHRIDEIALFRPDPVAQRLGYVRHSFNPRSPYQVIGNFFIGVAPLIGGTLVLCGLLWLLFPAAAQATLTATEAAPAIARGEYVEAVRMFLSSAAGALGQIATIGNLLSWRFWLLLYLALCIGSHMSPSRSDYAGAKWGGLLLLGLLVLVNLIFLAAGGSPGSLLAWAAPIAGPALALFVLCAVLCTAVSALVMGATQLLPR